MATIRDHVRANLGETYEILVGTAGYDESSGRPDAVGLKIAVMVSRLLTSTTTEDDVSEFARGYIGVVATRALVPLAVDYYMVRTRLADNLNRPAGMVPNGGEQSLNYNRVQALVQLDKLLAAQQAEMLPDFLEDVGDLARALHGFGARVGSDGSFLSDNPLNTFSRPGGVTVCGGQYGVVWGVIPDQILYPLSFDG